jgi:hypothetical protein
VVNPRLHTNFDLELLLFFGMSGFVIPHLAH